MGLVPAAYMAFYSPYSTDYFRLSAPPGSLTFSGADAALDANAKCIIMRGQRLPGPDIMFCKLLGVRLLRPTCLLQRLDLSDTGLRGSRDFAECFRGNTSLTDLQLENNFIADAGVLNLASALADTHVVHGSLRSNLVSVSPAVMQRFHDTLRTNGLPTALITLNAFARLPHPQLYVEATDIAGVCCDGRFADPHDSLQEFAETVACRLRPHYPACKLVFVTTAAKLVTCMQGMPVAALCVDMLTV